MGFLNHKLSGLILAYLVHPMNRWLMEALALPFVLKSKKNLIFNYLKLRDSVLFGWQ